MSTQIGGMEMFEMKIRGKDNANNKNSTKKDIKGERSIKEVEVIK